MRYHGQRICALKLGDGCPHGLEQIRLLLLVEVNAVGDDFGVGLGGELIAELLQLIAQLFVILDDAVVHDGDAIAGNVRVSVALGRNAMGCPPSVGNSHLAVRGRLAERFLQHFDLAHGAQALQVLSSVEHRDAGGVIAAVFQSAQSFDQDRYDVTIRNGPDNSAH